MSHKTLQVYHWSEQLQHCASIVPLASNLGIRHHMRICHLHIWWLSVDVFLATFNYLMFWTISRYCWYTVRIDQELRSLFPDTFNGLQGNLKTLVEMLRRKWELIIHIHLAVINKSFFSRLKDVRATFWRCLSLCSWDIWNQTISLISKKWKSVWNW